MKLNYIFTTFSFLFLLYVFYRAEIFYQGTKSFYYKPYYFISLFLILTSVLLYFFSKKIRTYFYLIFFSVFISFYCYETYLYFYLKSIDNLDLTSKTVRKEYFNKTGMEYDTRNILEVYGDLIKVEKKISINLGDIGYFLNKQNNDLRLFPLAPSTSNSKIIYCNENGYYATYVSDRYGFNNPDNQWDKNVIENVLIGDSYIEGSCVNRPEDISSVVRSKSGNTTLNLGVGGSGILIQLAILEEYLKNRKVNNLILFFYEGNDLKNLKNELDIKLLRNYLFKNGYSQELIKKQDDLNLLLDGYLKKVYKKNLDKNKSYLVQTDKKIKDEILKGIKLYRARNLIFKPQMDIPREFELSLKKIKTFAEKKNANIYFVYLPEFKRFNSFYYSEKQFNQVKNLVINQKIIFIDTIKEIFEKENDPLNLFPFKQRGHYTSEGYEKLGELILKKIK